MSQALKLTDAQADEILVAQLNVFALVAKRTANETDDRVIALLIDSERARAFVWSLLPLDHTQQMQLLSADSPMPLVAEASQYALTLLEIVKFVQKYGPQIKMIFQAVMDLAKEFKGLLPQDPGVSVTPGGQARPVINE